MSRSLSAKVIIRLLTIITAVLYLISLYFQYTGTVLSQEASEYQELVFQTMSGSDLGYALEKIAFVSGLLAGILGIILIILRHKYGILLFFITPFLLGLSEILGRPESAYPFLEKYNSILFLILASASWGATICYIITQFHQLFRTK